MTAVGLPPSLQRRPVIPFTQFPLTPDEEHRITGALRTIESLLPRCFNKRDGEYMLPSLGILAWMSQRADEMHHRGQDTRMHDACHLTLSALTGGEDLPLVAIDKDFLRRYIRYLDTDYRTRRGNTLAPVTARGYYRCLMSALNAAVRAELIAENPGRRLSPTDRIRVCETPRNFLTIDELRTLIDTPCSHPIVKQAYLFACYCGLRLSDIRRLRYADCHIADETPYLSIVMKKTGAPLHLPLSRQALRWIPDTVTESTCVFENLPGGTQLGIHLKRWVEAAGIRKHITFHTSRHTFATMLITLGADLFTTAKLLGHTKVSTTQIYARIIDSKKTEAVRLADEVF